MCNVVTKCPKNKVGKLIVSVEAPVEDVVDGVHIIAEHTESHKKEKLKTKREKKHPKYFWSSEMISGVARAKVPVGTYNVYLRDNDRVKKEGVNVQEKSKHNRRKPHVTFQLPVFRIEVVAENEDTVVKNVVFFVKCGDKKPVKLEAELHENTVSYSNELAWEKTYEIEAIEADEQLEFVEMVAE